MSGDRLVLRGITKRFATRGGFTTVLRDVDLDVEGGACLVLLGSSGSGKTTLLRIALGLETADVGDVVLGGRVLSDPRVRVAPSRRGIGMVFQALELWPHMTVAEHLAFGLPGRPRGKHALHDETVRQLAHDVGLEASHLVRRPDTLSGGERQRVAIARTLAPNPSVVLYDEPLANLDPSRRSALRALVRRLADERRTTTVYVTHDADEALAIGDEIAVIARGRVVERATPENLYRRPRSLAGARALGPVTVRAATVDGMRVHTSLGDGVAGDPEAAGAVDGAALALWRPEQIRPTSDASAPTGVVTSCRPAGADHAFELRLEDGNVFGRSRDAVVVGETIRIAVQGPVVVVPAPLVEESAA